MRFGTIGGAECLIILIVLVIATALAFRVGYFRGKDRERRRDGRKPRK